MFRPKDGHGLGNILMQLCQVNIVSDKIYDGNRGKFIKVHMCIVKDDTGDVDIIEPNLYITPREHKNIKHLIEPTDYAKIFIKKYIHLLNGVEFGIQIRKGALSSNKEVVKHSCQHINESGLHKFHEIVKMTDKNIFIAADCLETKKEFKRLYGDRIKYIDEECEYIVNSLNDEPWVSFTEFFLLGKCPHVYITGGNTDMSGFSTFGYMACMHTHTNFTPVFN